MFKFRRRKNQRVLKDDPKGSKNEVRLCDPSGETTSETDQKALSVHDLPARNSGVVHSDKALKESSGHRSADPIGLHIIHEPEPAPVVDIIFIHGLGGSSLQTWSMNRDPRLFWPGKWLPKETNISAARIMSFGYNAHFSSRPDKGTNLNISDFAKDLLFNMKFATGEGGSRLNIGSVPIIFIVHSMGGLVAKKAIILGQNDDHYREIIGAISAVVFLSTPHRGASMAATLNRILAAAFLTHSTKEYISELETNSSSIQEINDQFRNFAPSLSILSFFETRSTKIGPSSIMILNKDSSVLGYPGEISKPLDADHHNVCKYSSQDDPNYISVRNALIHLIEKVRSRNPSRSDLETVKTCLGYADDPHGDLDFFLERKLKGSCQWVLEHPLFTTFLSSDLSKSQILWFIGRPGRGKSVLSSFIIQHLLKNNFRVAYYFFRFGDPSKNNISAFLISIAYQIATQLPQYTQRLRSFSEGGLDVQKCAPRLLWQKLFVSSLFSISISSPLYLIIDGLDECENSPLAVNLLSDIVTSNIPIHLIMASRPTQLLTAAVTKTSKAITVQNFPLDEIRDDLQSYVEDEMITMHGDHDFKKRVENQILQKADGNFLWINLVLREILDCHTEEDVERALEEVPKGLESVYERIDATLSTNSRPIDLAMGRSILMWITCSSRALTLSELAEAMKPEYPHVLDLQFSISRVCGEFVVVDSKGIIGMIHATARDYLIKQQSLTFHVPFTISHQRIFATCLSLLISSSSRIQMRLVKTQSFLSYAATSWSYHLGLSVGEAYESSLSLLATFFQGHAVLSWIYILSLSGQLQLLVQASKTLLTFLGTATSWESKESHLTHYVRERELLSVWAVDLTRLVGKYGMHLISHPRLIFKLIAPFCPPKSAIYQQFGSRLRSPTLNLTSLSNSSWDSSLAKFVIPGQHNPSAIESFRRYFAILIPNESVILYSKSTCEIQSIFSHDKYILAWCFDQTGNMLATYSKMTTIIWSIAQGVKLCSIQNPPRSRALDMKFAKNEKFLLCCSEDCLIRQVSLDSPEYGWQVLGEVRAEGLFDGKPCGSPLCASFNQEGTQVAVSFRASQLYVWSIQDDQLYLVGRCEQAMSGRPGSMSNSFNINSFNVKDICWNGVTGHVLGSLNGGYIFKWHPIERDYQESAAVVLNMKCSLDGRFFVTSSKSGILKIWDFYHFAVVYELSHTGLVTSFAIDPNEVRIYDIRANFCNIWDPSPLVRFEDIDERSNERLNSRESSTNLSSFTETQLGIQPPATALALHPKNLTYALGNDDGIVTYYDDTGKAVKDLAVAFMTVEHICWSGDGTQVAYSGLDRTVTVKHIDQNFPSVPLETVLSIKEEHRIRQLHLSPDGKYLLVATGPIIRIWSVASKKIISWSTQIGASYWINSSSDSSQLLGFGYSTIYLCTWDNITDGRTLEIERGEIDHEPETDSSDILYRSASAQSPLKTGKTNAFVDKVLLTADRTMALVETSQGKDRGRFGKVFMLVPNLQSTTFEGQAITAKLLPTPLRTKIALSLGFLAADFANSRRIGSSMQSPLWFDSGHLFTFLDKEFWVCSYMLGESQTGRIKRHFILPREWWNMDSLELAVMRPDGALLCPRNGEVVIIINGLNEEWVD